MILIVDDQWIELRGWIELLKRRGFELELRSDADRALTDATTMANLEAAIIDVMMPAPVSWGDATRDGQATGLVLATKLRVSRPTLPIVFLTNQRNATVLDELKAFEKPSLYVDKRELNRTKLEHIGSWLKDPTG